MQDPVLSAYVADLGHKIAAQSDRPDLPFQFVVINNPEPNAWALPGGKIAINSGLIAILDNEAELASILAHEIAHATARHTAQRIERDMLLNSMSLLDVTVNPLALAETLYDVHTDLQDYKHSRDAEREADRYGIEYMARAGYDVRAAADAHRKLKLYFAQDEEEDGFIARLYYTHPCDDERIAVSQQIAEGYAKTDHYGEQEYLAATKSMKRTQKALVTASP